MTTGDHKSALRVVLCFVGKRHKVTTIGVAGEVSATDADP